MKNKKVTYILIAGVLMVWGIIFYRIFNSVSSDDENNVFIKSTTSLVKENYTPSDTFYLISNYRDPFLGNQMVHKVSNGTSGKRIARLPKVKEPEVKIDWSFISYLGLITNPKTNKKVVLINLKETQYMIEEGQTIENLKLVKNCKDSIKVSYMGKTVFLKR